MTRYWPLIVLCLLLSGCALGPNFHRPAVPKIHRYTEHPIPKATTSASTMGGKAQHFHAGQKISHQWWTVFQSKALNDVIKEAIAANPDLKAASAALRMAHHGSMIQRSAFLPLLTGNYMPTRQMTSGVLASNLSSNAYLYTLTTESVSVSYMPDVFGATRRQVESAVALEEVAMFNCEAIYLTLTSNVVLAAIQEASLRGQLQAVYRSIAIMKKLYHVSQEQMRLGDIGAEGVAAQAALLAQTESLAPPLQLQLAQNRHLLASLLGRYSSEDLGVRFDLADFVLPNELPLSFPAQVVDQRPDIRAAEAQMHSASALIGVAIANRFPNITLSGNGGYLPVTESLNSIPSFLTPLPLGSTLFWGIGANLAGTIFDAGSLLFQQRAAVAAFDQSVAQYRRVVLNAFENVADSLKAIEWDAIALKRAKQQADAAKTSFQLAKYKRQFGAARYLELLVAEQTYQQALINLAQTKATRYADTAALFQALGGGWDSKPHKLIKHGELK